MYISPAEGNVGKNVKQCATFLATVFLNFTLCNIVQSEVISLLH